MLSPRPENAEIIGRLAVDHHLVDLAFKDHPGNTLKSVFKTAGSVLYRLNVLAKPGIVFNSHLSPPIQFACFMVGLSVHNA